MRNDLSDQAHDLHHDINIHWNHQELRQLQNFRQESCRQQEIHEFAVQKVPQDP